jgi:kinesin family protein 5
VTCSPHPYNLAETISTLRFGTQARQIKNQPKVNREFSVPELKLLLERADKEIGDKKAQITVLENIIQECGAQLPENLDDKIEQAVKEMDDELERKIEEEETEIE